MTIIPQAADLGVPWVSAEPAQTKTAVCTAPMGTTITSDAFVGQPAARISNALRLFRNAVLGGQIVRSKYYIPE